MDEDGPGGCPWTCIAPDIGYPTGWAHPNIVWDPGLCKSLFIAPFFAPRNPADVEEFPEGAGAAEFGSWGQIKALFGD